MHKTLRPVSWLHPWLVTLMVSGCYQGGGKSQAQEVDVADGGGNTDGQAETQGESGAGDEGVPSYPDISECRRPSYEVYLRLAPTCAGCHGNGANFAAFGDFTAFERLIIGDANLVKPGDPEQSGLFPMLEGSAPPPLRQMPPGVNTFADMDEAGATQISMAELRDWVTKLEPCELPPDSTSPQFVRRASVEQITAMLYAQLELTMPETLRAFPVRDPTFPLPGYGGDESTATARWRALGGPNYLTGDIRSEAWGPQVLQSIGPMAQAWCRTSIRQGRTALFRHVGPDSNSATDATAIRKNIEYLYLRILGVEATQGEVEELYRGVYLPYESAEDGPTAWTGVCAALIRDPMWLSL